MNIKSAKQEIENTVKAYLYKNEFGDYYIGKEKQRPIFMIGAPGIGKTAIMQQIAKNLKINLISYSLTHHTRQSALGLPFINHKEYKEQNYSITEYTMSEIIASIYECIERTGIQEGILFLDEINCISETLTPIMLQFLQYKCFGSHSIPEGWILVTAGNPPEFNYSVREFDIATLDRLKVIPVEADYEVWKEYAYASGIHPAILTYLDAKKTYFYEIKTTVEGMKFVTARGWEDLSLILQIYEKLNIKVDETLISQYLQYDTIAFDFSAYYELYCSYRLQFNIPKLLKKEDWEESIEKLTDAKLEERLSFIGLLTEVLTEEVRKQKSSDGTVNLVYQCLKSIKNLAETNPEKLQEILAKHINQLQEEKKNLELKKHMDQESKVVFLQAIEIIENYKKECKNFEQMKNEFEKLTQSKKEQTATVKVELETAFSILEEAFGEGEILLLFVANYTLNPLFTWFTAKYGCEKYFQYNKELLLYEREQRIITRIHELENM